MKRTDIIVRATIPALRRLLDTGSIIRPDGKLWHVTLRRKPHGIVMAYAPHVDDLNFGGRKVTTYIPAIRLVEEPPFPGEVAADPDTITYWEGLYE